MYLLIFGGASTTALSSPRVVLQQKNFLVSRWDSNPVRFSVLTKLDFTMASWGNGTSQLHSWLKVAWITQLCTSYGVLTESRGCIFFSCKQLTHSCSSVDQPQLWLKMEPISIFWDHSVRWVTKSPFFNNSKKFFCPKASKLGSFVSMLRVGGCILRVLLCKLWVH